MNLEEIFKLISPVVFVLIWLYSAVYGDGQKATKTSSPVFTPPRRPQPERTAASGTAKAAESASESRFDWGNVIQDQPKQPFGAAEPSMSQTQAAMKATIEARAKAKERAESRAQAQAQAAEKAHQLSQDGCFGGVIITQIHQGVFFIDGGEGHHYPDIFTDPVMPDVWITEQIGRAHV